MGNARASMRGTDSRTNPRFFISLIENDERYMKTDTPALSNAVNRGGGNNPPDVGLTSNVLPETIRIGIGVSSDYAQKDNHQWYVLRATYNRVEKNIETLKKNVAYVYIPKHHVIKNKNGKKKRVLEPLLPNLVFVYSTQSHLEELFREENDLDHLRFYRDKTKDVSQQDGKHPPIVVPYYEMLNFIKLTSVDNEHIKLVELEHCHYKSGDKVRIVEGDFAGVVGRVARIAGQQRVVVELNKLCMVATAYIPTVFLIKINM